MILGEAIKTLRLRLSLTQEDVCKRANLTQGYYSSIENGGMPSLETLNKLAAAFDLPTFFLIWLATQKQDISKHQRSVLYNTLKPVLDNIIEEIINKQK